MFFKKKQFNSYMIQMVKTFKKNDRHKVIKPFYWVKFIGFLKNSLYLLICNKRKRFLRPHQALIGYSLYYSSYHNKNATFRAKVEKKKKQKKEKEIIKEKKKQQSRNAWKEKIIKPKIKQKIIKNIKTISLNSIKKSIEV